MSDKMPKGYDVNQKKFKVRTKELTLAMSLRQLSDWSGVELTEARQAAPHWNRYKKMMLEQAIAARMSSVDHLAYMVPSSFVFMGAKPEKPANQVDLKKEVDEYAKRKGGSYKTHLPIFLKVVGNMTPKEFCLEHYRQWLKWVEDNHTGSKTTSQNRIKSIKTFLTNLETIHSLDLRFLRSTDLHRLNIDDVAERDLSAEFWTVEEIKKAISSSTGLAKFSLLMGLNCGAYDCDLSGDYFNADKIIDGNYCSGRAKNLRNGVQKGGVGVWKLWPATQAALVYGANKRTMRDHFAKMRASLGITKTQEALRKTIANEIQYKFGEETARVYRAEFTNDTHHKSYINIRDERRFVKLTEALEHIGRWLGVL